LALLLGLCSSATIAQTAYRYKDANGQWIYTDKAPPSAARDDSISLGHHDESMHVEVARTDSGNTTQLTAINDCLCVVAFTAKVLHSDDPSIPTNKLYQKVLQPHTRALLVSVANAGAQAKDFNYQWLASPGSPDAVHHPPRVRTAHRSRSAPPS
jgi:hypothetical protein